MTEPLANPLPLAAEFPAATREQWLGLVARVLKGAPFERLVASSADGLAIAPLHARAPEARHIFGRAAGTPWQVLQRIDHPDPDAANAQAREDLANGAAGLVLVGADSIGAHEYGAAASLHTMERMLRDVPLDTGITIEFDIGPQTMLLPLAFASLVGNRGVAPQAVNVRFAADPFGDALLHGGFAVARDVIGQSIGRFAAESAAIGFRRALFVADGRIVHDAGGTQAQELAYVLAAAVTYLRAFEAHGIALEDARRMIFFRLTADADQILTLTKFRTLRKLWKRVEETCGLAPAPAFVTAETAWRTMTRCDPYMNILRATIAVVAAGLGGADAITVLPFTAARGLPDAFARRIARNTQLVLIDEGQIAKVADPAAGTGWSETLGDALCRAAWSLFQEIEAAGGAAAALERGLIQDKVAHARAERERAIAMRRDALIGVNEFPDLGEVAVSVLDAAPVSIPAMPRTVAVTPLAQMRLAEPFEALREASDRMRAETGVRPKVFVANLGTPADVSAPTTYAKNFFAAGGIEAATHDGGEDLQALAAAFATSGAAFACLCSSAQFLARDARAASEALRTAGARKVYAAGPPGSGKPPAQLPGVDAFIDADCDALAILREASMQYQSMLKS